MRTIHFGLVPIIQSAGPQWHLLGSVRRDPYRRGALTLARPVDALSPKISAMVGRLIREIRITGVSGSPASRYTTALLRNAVIFSVMKAPRSGPSSGAGTHSLHTDETESISLKFEKIAYESATPAAGGSDDWA